MASSKEYIDAIATNPAVDAQQHPLTEQATLANLVNTSTMHGYLHRLAAKSDGNPWDFTKPRRKRRSTVPFVKVNNAKPKPRRKPVVDFLSKENNLNAANESASATEVKSTGDHVEVATTPDAVDDNNNLKPPASPKRKRSTSASKPIAQASCRASSSYEALPPFSLATTSRMVRTRSNSEGSPTHPIAMQQQLPPSPMSHGMPNLHQLTQQQQLPLRPATVLQLPHNSQPPFVTHSQPQQQPTYVRVMPQPMELATTRTVACSCGAFHTDVHNQHQLMRHHQHQHQFQPQQLYYSGPTYLPSRHVVPIAQPGCSSPSFSSSFSSAPESPLIGPSSSYEFLENRDNWTFEDALSSSGEWSPTLLRIESTTSLEDVVAPAPPAPASAFEGPAAFVEEEDEVINAVDTFLSQFLTLDDAEEASGTIVDAADATAFLEQDCSGEVEPELADCASFLNSILAP